MVLQFSEAWARLIILVLTGCLVACALALFSSVVYNHKLIGELVEARNSWVYYTHCREELTKTKAKLERDTELLGAARP